MKRRLFALLLAAVMVLSLGMAGAEGPDAALETEEVVGTNVPEETASGDNEVVSAEDEVIPAENETAPAEDEVVPAESETTPAEDEVIPAEDETAPAEDEVIPAEDETAPLAEETPAQIKVSVIDDQFGVFLDGYNPWYNGDGTGTFEIGGNVDIYVLDAFELKFDSFIDIGRYVTDEYIKDPTGKERYVHVYHLDTSDLWSEVWIRINVLPLEKGRVTVSDPEALLQDGKNDWYWQNNGLINVSAGAAVYLKPGYDLEKYEGDGYSITTERYTYGSDGVFSHMYTIWGNTRLINLKIVKGDPADVPALVDVTYNDPDGAIRSKPAKAVTEQPFNISVKKGYTLSVSGPNTHSHRLWTDGGGGDYDQYNYYVSPEEEGLTFTAEKAQMVTLVINDPNKVLSLTDSRGWTVYSGSQYLDGTDFSYTLQPGWRIGAYGYITSENSIRLWDEQHIGTVTIAPQKIIYLHVSDPDKHIADSVWEDGEDITGCGDMWIELDGEYSLAVTGGKLDDVYFSVDPDTDKLTRTCLVRVDGDEDVTITPVADPGGVPDMTTFTYNDPDGAILNKPSRTTEYNVTVKVKSGYSLQVTGGNASRGGVDAASGSYIYSISADYQGTNVTVTAVKSDNIVTLQIDDPYGALTITDEAGSPLASGAKVSVGTRLPCLLQPGYYVNSNAGHNYDENNDLVSLTVLDMNLDGIEWIGVEKAFRVVLNDPQKVIENGDQYEDAVLYGAGGRAFFTLQPEWELEVTNGSAIDSYFWVDPVTGEVGRTVEVICAGTGDVTVTPVKSTEAVPTPMKVEYEDPYGAILDDFDNHYFLPGDGFNVLMKAGYTLQVVTGGEIMLFDPDTGYDNHIVNVSVALDATAVKVTAVPIKAGAKLVVSGAVEGLTTTSPDRMDHNAYLSNGAVITTGTGYVLVKNGYELRAVSGCAVDGGYYVYGKVGGDVCLPYLVQATGDTAAVEIVPAAPAKWVDVTIVNNSSGYATAEGVTEFSTYTGTKTITILVDDDPIVVGTDYGCSIKVTGGTYSVNDGPASMAYEQSFYVKTTGSAVTVEVNKTGACTHEWDKGVVTVEPTCLEGVRTYTCTVCGLTKTEPVPAAKDHTWGDVTVTVNPTYVAEGKGTHTCSVCGKQEEVAVPVLAPKTGAEVPAGTVQDAPAAQAALSTAAQGVVDALASGTVPAGGSQALVDAIQAELAKVSADGGEATVSTKLVVASEAVTVSGAAAQYDIEIQVFVNDTEVGNLTAVPRAIGLTLPLPAAAGRIVYVVRIHNGVQEKLPTTVSNGTVNFASDKFSTYAIMFSNDLADATVDQIADQTYTGSEIKPAVKVTIQGPNGTETLTEGVDYTLSYKNNTAAGTGTVVITGMGDFAGSVREVTFKIVRPAGTSAPSTVPDTGDETPLTLYAGLLALSAAGLALVLGRKKRTEK